MLGLDAVVLIARACELRLRVNWAKERADVGSVRSKIPRDE